MTDFELTNAYYKVLINELYENNSIYNTSNIENWYSNCVAYIKEMWKEYLGISDYGISTEYSNNIYQLIEQPGGIRDQTYKMFKQFYENEKMIGILKDYNYTEKDDHIKHMLEVELNKTCDWLVVLLVTCIKYHLLRVLDEKVQMFIAEYGSDYADKILYSANIKLQKINKFEPQIVSKYLTNYNKIVQRFINDYKSGKITPTGELSNKLVSINEVKDFAHFSGSLLQGDDPFYIFDDEHKDLYDSITNLNDKQIQFKLEKLLGYR